jgi:hypothetical protein
MVLRRLKYCEEVSKAVKRILAARLTFVVGLIFQQTLLFSEPVEPAARPSLNQHVAARIF